MTSYADKVEFLNKKFFETIVDVKKFVPVSVTIDIDNDRIIWPQPDEGQLYCYNIPEAGSLVGKGVKSQTAGEFFVVTCKNKVITVYTYEKGRIINSARPEFFDSQVGLVTAELRRNVVGSKLSKDSLGHYKNEAFIRNTRLQQIENDDKIQRCERIIQELEAEYVGVRDMAMNHNGSAAIMERQLNQLLKLKKQIDESKQKLIKLNAKKQKLVDILKNGKKLRKAFSTKPGFDYVTRFVGLRDHIIIRKFDMK